MSIDSRHWLAALLAIVLGNFAQSGSAGEVEFRKQYLDGRFGQIHVLISRPADREVLRTPMVCFAPNPMAGRYYRLFMAELGRDRLMIAPDYPGLGESDPPDEIPELAGYAGAMADAIEALGFGSEASSKVDVCGYHTGAMVAVELARARPDLVHKLLLMGVPYYSGEQRAEMYAKNVVEEPLEEDFESLDKWWQFTVTGREDGVSLERGYDNFVDVLKPKYRQHWPYHAVFSYPAESKAGQVSQPVLLLNTHGGLAEETRAFAQLLPQAQLIEVPELHHGIFDVGARRLAELARPFLDQAAETDPITTR